MWLTHGIACPPTSANSPTLPLTSLLAIYKQYNTAMAACSGVPAKYTKSVQEETSFWEPGLHK
jgi:hypothetical protein